MKNIQFKKSERGSAILMTLGVLSIVMVIGMLFVAMTRNTRIIADAGADDVRAAVLAESAEAFALSILQEMTQTKKDYRPANSTILDADDNPVIQYQPKEAGDDDEWHQPYIGNFSSDGGIVGCKELTKGAYTQNAIFTKPDDSVYTTTEMNRTDSADGSYPHRLWTPVQKSHLKDLATTVFAGLDNVGVGFQNVTVPDSDDPTKDEIIGRYGFVILPEGSKINLNAIINPHVGAKNHPIPALEDSQTVKLDGSVSLSTVDMPLGMSDDPNSEKDTGAFLVMGFDSFDDYDYAEEIDELATLRYGLHPQEIRAPAAAYATPPGKALKWHSYLQLGGLPDFSSGKYYAFLFGLTGGKDEPEMVFDGHVDLGDDANIDSTTSLTKMDADTQAYVPLLGKQNIQLADLKCGSNDTLGWEGLSRHFAEGGCILHKTCAWYEKLFRKTSIMGGQDDMIEFQDEDGENINVHIMANLVDFCDEDDEVTYLIDGSRSNSYDNLESLISDIDTLEDYTDAAEGATNDQFIIGNELHPAVIGVMFEAKTCEGATIENRVVDGETPTYVWTLAGTPRIRLVPTVSLANIYPQLEADTHKYEGKIFFSFTVNFEYEMFDTSSDVPPTASEAHGFASATFDKDALGNDIMTPEKLKVVDLALDETNFPEIDLSDISESGAGTITKVTVSCSIDNVLVALAYVDDSSNKHLVDIARFANNETPPTDAGDEIDVADSGARPTATKSTPLKAFRPNDAVPAPAKTAPWVAYACADDPRCNDRLDTWSCENAFVDGDREATATLRGESWKNIVAKCGVTSGDDQDWEPDLDELDADGKIGDTFSTAFIADEPMTSLWQLGAVHRYEVGCTINLRTYNEKLYVSGGKYASGDAALLDFLKVTEATNGIGGKFNPNCFSEGAYKYLLKDVPFGGDATIYRPVAGNPTLEEAGEDVDTYVSFASFDDMEKLYKNQSWLPMQAFMKFCKPKDGGCSDREIEAFYGCTAGLLSTRYETFTVITVGQSLLWLDGIPATTTATKVKKMGGVNPVLLDGKWYSTLGTRVQSITILRDCWLNNFKIVSRQRL